jgi:hypothetical protein
MEVLSEDGLSYMQSTKTRGWLVSATLLSLLPAIVLRRNSVSFLAIIAKDHKLDGL